MCNKSLLSIYIYNPFMQHNLTKTYQKLIQRKIKTYFSMNIPTYPSNSGNQSPKREIQGPRPSPLKVQKTSHKVKKPPQQIQSQHRPPVIIYTVSPTVIHTNPSDFRSLVQRLTGSNQASSVQQELQSKSAADEMMISEPGPGPGQGQGRVGILSPGPGSMPTISPSLFTPSGSVGFLHGLSPVIGGFGGQNRNFVDNGFLISPGNLFSSSLFPSPNNGYWDLFNQYRNQ